MKSETWVDPENMLREKPALVYDPTSKKCPEQANPETEADPGAVARGWEGLEMNWLLGRGLSLEWRKCSGISTAL